METLMLLTYAALCIVVFKVFRIPLNKWTVPTAVLGGIALIGAVINGVYLQAVLKGWRNSLLFVAALLLLDGVMWLLLRSEDSALLLGTGVLLLALCALMFLTRRVDWYALSLPQSNPQKPQSKDEDTLRIWK